MAQHEYRVLWWNVSLPLCHCVLEKLIVLYSHVARTGDIKQFVIIEESGIAKGTRRIIAVTGQEAQEVIRQAETLQERLQQVERMTGQTKDTALKTLTVVRAIPLLVLSDFAD